VSTNIFQRIAARYIVPAKTPVPHNGGVFDIESNGLLDTATKIHCIVIAELDSDRVHEYDPKQIKAGLKHLSRLDYLVGHNVAIFDLPLLLQLHGWAPKADCRVVDTLNRRESSVLPPTLASQPRPEIARPAVSPLGRRRD
jgi:hypothetical protein